MKSRKFSLKYKIMIMLTLVPLITLSVYLVLAINTFREDKIAYIYDSTSAVAKTLASQASTDFNALLGMAQPMIQEFFLDGQFNKVTEAIIKNEGPVQWIAAIKVSANKTYEKKGNAERVAGSMAADEALLAGKLQNYMSMASTKGRYLRFPFGDDRVLLIEKVENPKANEEYLFVIVAKMTELANSFRAPVGSEVYLIDDIGSIIFGPVDLEMNNLSERIDTSDMNFAKSKEGGFTRETKSIEGDLYLASYVRGSFGGLAIVSLTKKSSALAAIELLKKKSLVFFALLISATIIVSLFASGSITSALQQLFLATQKVAEGDFDIRVKVTSSDEVGSLAESFNAMAAEVSRLLLETAEKARMEGELKTAQTVQETLFPEANAKIQGLNVSGFYEPASECGGDWWHYCQVGQKVYLWIGDATGHGAPAALITSAAKSAATIIESLNLQPKDAMALLNRAIYDVSKGRIMMTFVLAVYDTETKELTYANASHEAPFLIPYSEQPLKKKDLIPLNDVNGPRLGQARDTVYDQIAVKLGPGDRILFYTDGVADIQSPEKQSWGEREFIKSILKANSGFPELKNSKEEIVTTFKNYRHEAPLIDDVTFFMVGVERNV